MPITLYHGAAGAQKSRALLKRCSDLTLSEILFVLPHSHCINQTQNNFFKHGYQKGTLLNDNFLTLPHFLLKWLKLYEPRVHFVSHLYIKNAVRSILYQLTNHEFKQFLNDNHTLNEITHTLISLYKAGLNSFRAEQFFKNTDALKPVVQIMKDFEILTYSKHAYDEGLLTTSLIEKLDNKGINWFNGVKTLIIDRMFPIGPGLREILLRLSKKIPDLDILISYSMDYNNSEESPLYGSYTAIGEIAEHHEYFHLTKNESPIILREFHYPSDELEHLVKRILSLKETGCQWADISVVLPKSEYTHKRFFLLCRLNNIPNSGIKLKHPQHIENSKPEDIVSTLNKTNSIHLEVLNNLQQSQNELTTEWDFIRSQLFEDIAPNIVNEWYNQELEHLGISTNSKSGIHIYNLDTASSIETKYLFIIDATQENYLTTDDSSRALKLDNLSQPEMIEIFGSAKYNAELNTLQWQSLLNRNTLHTEISYSNFSWQHNEHSLIHFLNENKNIYKEESSAITYSDAIFSQKEFPKRKQDSYSISELETYYKCPFQFYAKYHLKIEEWNEDSPDIRANIAGLLIHRVLDKLYGENTDLFNEACDYELYLKRFKSLIPDLLNKIVVNDPNIQKSPNIIVKDYIQRAHDALNKLVDFEIQQIKNGVKSTKPFAFEWAFGKGKTPALTLKNNNEIITITGRIDRIDIDKNNQYYSVIDYKTGELTSGKSIKEGFSPQIPLYMMAVKQHLLPEYEPTSGLLIGLKEVGKNSGLVIDGTPEEKYLWRTYKVKLEEWESIQQKVIENIFKAHEQINCGNFAPQPRSSKECERCGYSKLCHYTPESTESEGTE